MKPKKNSKIQKHFFNSVDSFADIVEDDSGLKKLNKRQSEEEIAKLRKRPIKFVPSSIYRQNFQPDLNEPIWLQENFPYYIKRHPYNFYPKRMHSNYDYNNYLEPLTLQKPRNFYPVIRRRSPSVDEIDLKNFEGKRRIRNGQKSDRKEKLKEWVNPTKPKPKSILGQDKGLNPSLGLKSSQV